MNYAKIFSGAAIVAFIIVMGTVAITLGAEQMVCPDCEIQGTVSSVATLTTQDGEPFTRVLTSFNREMNGIKYTVILPVMGFGEQAEPAAKLNQGDPLKAIVQNRIFQGRESYTIIQLIE